MGNRFGLLVFDEEHHLPGKCRRDAALLSCAPMRLFRQHRIILAVPEESLRVGATAGDNILVYTTALKLPP